MGGSFFHRLSLVFLVVFSVLACPVSVVHASFFDTFGVDARGMALGGAMTAASEGWASVHYNPAALALSRDIEFSFGFSYTLPYLETAYENGPEDDLRQFPRRDGGLDSIAGPSFGLVLPVERCTPRDLPVPVAIGVGLFVPRQTLATIRVVEQAYPFDLVFNERNASLCLNMAVSTRITPALYLGVGMASQLVSGMEMNLSETGNEDASEVKVRFGIPSFLAGLLFRPSERIRVGVVYRQKNEIRSQWNAFVQTRIDIFPFGPDPDLGIGFYQEQTLVRRYVSGFTPENISLGASYKLTQRIRILAEVGWYRWSKYRGPVEAGLLFEFNDILVPRIGVIYRITRELEARCGFYYEPTPVTSQGTGFYPIGNDRYVPSLGLGYTFDCPWGLLAKPVSADAYFQYHIFQEKDFFRAVSTSPFARSTNLTAKGSVFNVGMSLTFRF